MAALAAEWWQQGYRGLLTSAFGLSALAWLHGKKREDRTMLRKDQRPPAVWVSRASLEPDNSRFLACWESSAMCLRCALRGVAELH